MSEHAAERLGKRHSFGGKGAKIEAFLEARLRLIGRDDFEELLLPRRRPHGVEQGDIRPRPASVVHGKARISSCAPGAKPSLPAGTSIQPSARVSACIGQ